MKQLLTSILFLCFSCIFAQNCSFKGTVVDTEGNAIPFTSVYISSIANGSMANIDGSFSISAPCNSYTIQFQSLGYEKKAIQIDLSTSKEQQVVLKRVSYNIGAVDVDASQEDIAYSYIRKATAMAEYYKKQITAYKCELYIRSFYDPEKIPWLAKKLIPEEDLAEMSTGNISETLLEYSFKRPNTVTQKILAAKSGRLDSLKNGAQYINLNFYNLGGAAMINPLSRNAFAVYEFEHISTYYEDGKGVHKIKIIPRRNGNDLMSGYIYINDNVWNINNVDVSFQQPLAKLRYEQVYNEVRPNVWMPINHKITADVEIMGYEMELKYLSTLSKLKVETDPEVDQKIMNSLNLVPEEVKFDGNIPTEKKVKLEKLDAKIEKIITKDRVTKGESLKLIRLIKQKERQLETVKPDTGKTLEVTLNRKITFADSIFSKSDSIWNSTRTIPLSSQEQQIYIERDSLEKTISGDTAIAEERSLFGHLLFYDTPFISKNKKFRFTPYGLLKRATGEFNTVNGVTPYKTLFSIEWQDKKGKSFGFEPTLGYAFERKRFLYEGKLRAQYNGKKRASFFGTIGRLTDDFNREEPIPLLGNTISSLFYTQNSKKFYEADFFKIGHQVDVINGLQFVVRFDYENRTAQQNNSDFTLTDWWDLDYTSNTPNNSEVLNNNQLINDHKSASLDVELNYTHKQYYRFKDGTKEVLRSKFPTLTANYRQGLDGFLGSEADYQFVSFAVNQELPFKRINRLRYHVEVGTFLQNNTTFFADYKNFNASPLLFLSNDFANSFKLLDNYRFNTNNRYFEAHLSVEDNRILLKRIPLFASMGITETLNANYLITEQNVNYSEIGYSVDRIFFGMKVGVYAAFEDDKFAAWNVRIGLGGFLNR